MGIRYSAYAFDNHQRQQVVRRPWSVVSQVPPACGCPPRLAPRGLPAGWVSGWPGPPRDRSDDDWLDLDKAWSDLQRITRPVSDDETPRAAYAMFEGDVTWTDRRSVSWIRAILPEDVPAVAADLTSISRFEVARGAMRSGLSDRDPEAHRHYVQMFLDDARRFVTRLADEGRGMVYRIG